MPAGGGAGVPVVPARPGSRRRLWFFRLTAGILFPLLVLTVVELALRLAGFGYPTRFFLRTRIDGREFYVPNDKFAHRFFPPGIARPPTPLRMLVEKPANLKRIFLFGESAAMGDPEPAFGMGRYLAVLLRERYPGTEFEVVPMALTAINSHTVLPMARECAGMQSDLWIIYLGNNEMIGPFGAGTAFGPRVPALGFIRASLALKTTKLGQLLESLARRFSTRAGTPKAWASMKMFTEHQLAFDDPARLRVYELYRRNLADILRAGNRAGVPIVLSTMAANLKDCPPFGSLHRSGLGDDQKVAWERVFQEGIEFETTGAFQKALEAYEKAAAIDSQYAELRFRLGRCRFALSDFSGAQSEFSAARDFDTLEFRADSRINQIIRDAAGTDRAVGLVDADAALAPQSAGGIPGNETFYEHVHLNFAGNYLLARAFADQVAKLLPASVVASGKGTPPKLDVNQGHEPLSANGDLPLPRPFGRGEGRGEGFPVYRKGTPPKLDVNQGHEPLSANGDLSLPRPFGRGEGRGEGSEAHGTNGWASAEDCERQLAVTDWDRFRVWREIRARFTEPPFTGQLDHAASLKMCDAKLAGLQSALGGDAVARARDVYQAAVDAVPDDLFVHENFAVFLEATGDLPKAISETERVRDLVPQAPMPYYYLGRLLVRRGDGAAAAESLAAALFRRTDFVPALNELAEIRANQGKTAEALALFDRAAHANPDLAETYIDRGFVLQTAGKMEDAMAAYDTAARLQPRGPAVYFRDGCQFAAQRRRDEAIERFQAAVRLDPGFWQARYLLGSELAARDKIDEAREQFVAAIRLRPDYARAHSNLGTALAKRNLFDQALVEFREGLRLNPNDETARKNIAAITAMKNR